MEILQPNVLDFFVQNTLKEAKEKAEITGRI
jgi:hypothetical protein